MKLDRKKMTCAMIDSNMNNTELAKASETTRERISCILHGNDTSYKTACKIAKALNVPVQELIDFEGSEDEQ